MLLSDQANEEQLSLLSITKHYVEHNYQEDITNNVSSQTHRFVIYRYITTIAITKPKYAKT